MLYRALTILFALIALALATVLVLRIYELDREGQSPGHSPTIVQEIHSKHFFYGYPLGTPPSNDLIIRDIYALSSNDNTKLADWVSYRLDKSGIHKKSKQTRRWKPDPWLEANETLEPGDYKGASRALSTDRGHQAPLASFSGSSTWEESNYLSNITPQKAALNQGPWRFLEEKVRKLVKNINVVHVMTGPLYERPMKLLPGADETHSIPSGYWKIILVQEKQKGSRVSIKASSFIFDQDTPKDAKILSHLVTIDEIEKRSKLDFLWELPDSMEETIESNLYKKWSTRHFQ